VVGGNESVNCYSMTLAEVVLLAANQP